MNKRGMQIIPMGSKQAGVLWWRLMGRYLVEDHKGRSLFFFFWHIHGMWKFWDQGWNRKPVLNGLCECVGMGSIRHAQVILTRR